MLNHGQEAGKLQIFLISEVEWVLFHLQTCFNSACSAKTVLSQLEPPTPEAITHK